jgi:hypothetical protein
LIKWFSAGALLLGLYGLYLGLFVAPTDYQQGESYRIIFIHVPAAWNTVHIRASANIGEMCADYVRSKHFDAPGMLGRVMRQLAEGEATREEDLLSYLLFDGRSARDRMDLGRQDGRAHHDQLCALFEAVREATTKKHPKA